MKRYTAQGIVLTRTNFGEADRIISFLTREQGKVRAMAKGVRKAGAKLAGSLELFSVSDLTLIPGRADIDTLISARLARHYGNIQKQPRRLETAFELLKLTERNTEDKAEPDYFELLNTGLQSLDDQGLNPVLTQIWFHAQLLKLAGHEPTEPSRC